MRIAVLVLFSFLVYINSDAQNDCSSGCDPLWLEVPFGGDIGTKNAFIKYDFDKDGELDIITFEVIEVDESHSNGISSTRNGSFLYAMKYNVSESLFEKIHITDIQKVEFSHMARGDINNDGRDELILTVYRDHIYIYDLETLELIDCLDRPWEGGHQEAYELQIMDIDKDGQNEILVSTRYEFHIYDSNTLVEEFHVSGAGSDFEVGNVDNDPELEIVLSHGVVYEYNNQSYHLEYELNVFLTDFVELWDIDNDGNKEVVIERQHNIALYDVESSSLLYDKSLGGDQWIISDLEMDGNLEFITVDDFWQELSVYNLASGNLIYELDIDLEPHRSRLFSMLLDDFDGDNDLELMLTFDDLFGTPGGIRIYNISNGNIEHESYGEMGAYRALEIEDIDGDGNFEIIAASGEGPGYGNDYAHINIFDASTKELERRITMPEGISLESRHIEVSDYRNDGDLDIVVLADNFPSQNILVFDGASGDIEHDALFWGFRDLKAYVLDDIDEDGVVEILAASQEILRVLNPNDLSTEWESFDLNQFYDCHTIITGNIDDDSSSEMIMSKEWVYRFDDHNNNYDLVQSAKSNYRAIHLFDWNNDGTKEILAGTTDGLVDVLNGTNMNIISSFRFSNGPISAIGSGDVDGDGISEVIVTAMDQLYIHRLNMNTQISQVYGIEVGEYDGLKLEDVNNDGSQEIFVGSWYGLLEVDKTCGDCYWVDFSPRVVQPTCYEDNGWILVKSGDPTARFTLDNIEVTDTLKNLGPGTYNFVVTNELGCQLNYEVRLDYENDFQLDDFEVSWKDPVCGGDGIIYVETLNPDLEFTIDGVEIIDSINNLYFGNYEVFVSNRYGCFKEVSVELDEPVIPVFEIITTGCGPDDYKYIDLYLRNDFGHNPRVYWNDEFIEKELFSNYIITPEVGIGRLEIRMNECSIYSEIEITPIDPLNTLEFDLIYENIACNDTQTFVFIGNVKNGQEPYHAIWDGVEFLGFNVIAEEGTHVVELRDDTGCSTTKFFEVFKDPEISYDFDIIYGGCQNLTNNYAVISNLANEGQAYSITWDGIFGGLTSFALDQGEHRVSIFYGTNCHEHFTFTIDANENLEANLIQTNNYCGEFNLASAEVDVLKGTAPFEYLWSENVSNNHIAENLHPGTYWVTVTDADSCQTVLSVNIENQELLVDFNLTEILCHGDITGSIEIEVISGQGPYEYFLNGNPTTQYIDDLEAAAFEISVEDVNGCSVLQNVSIDQPEALVINAVINPDSLATTQLEGSIEVTVSGGIEPYAYFWTTGSNEDLVSELSNGVYYFSVEDFNGCMIDSIFTINGVTNTADYEDFNISIYPNPTQQIVHVEFDETKKIEDLRLFSLDGKLINRQFDKIVSGRTHKVDLGTLANGVYVLALTIDGKTLRHKIAVYN